MGRSVPRQTAGLALAGLRTWSRRQVLVSLGAAAVFGGALGMATVLIPNPFFGREIPPVWWNYPVWVLTSLLTGMLVATYVRSPVGVSDGSDDPDGLDGSTEADERRTSRLGMAGGVLAWFAIGCPVCNKIALLALGYSGAITWFTPVQPFLAVGALTLTGVALVWRLRGAVVCSVPAVPRRTTNAHAEQSG